MADRLRREDEAHMNLLREKRDAGTFSEEDDAMLSVLEDRYAKFLDAGLRKLRESSPVAQISTSSHGGSGVGRLFSSPFKKDASNRESPLRLSVNDASFSNPPLSKSEGGAANSIQSLDRKASIFLGNHWSWVTENLIVGAVPFAAPSPPDRVAHILLLRDQLKERKQSLSLVVSVAGIDELSSSPAMASFASTRDWEQILHVPTFAHLPLPANGNDPIDVTFDEVLEVSTLISSTIAGEQNASSDSSKTAKGRSLSLRGLFGRSDPCEESHAVYVHCLAGKQRCWVMGMCYLMSMELMSFDEAALVFSTQRPSCAPSDVQTDYVRRFAAYLEANPAIRNKHAEEEQRYSDILAQILLLSPSYRAKLLQDLEKLT